jgi:hypothetical protein
VSCFALLQGLLRSYNIKLLKHVRNKHTMIRVKSAQQAPSAMDSAFFSHNHKVCTKQKYGTALVLISETISQKTPVICLFLVLK